jgi:hypothetical protein
MATAPDPVEGDVDDFQHAAAMKERTRTLRLAVVLIKIIAVLYFVVGAGSAIYEYSKQSSDYDQDLAFYNQISATNPYATPPDKPSSTAVLVAVFRDGLVAFFVWVSGAVIKLQLAIADDTALLRSRSDARADRPSPDAVP